ncbi:MAG: molybdopterin adenylyltransferase [Candidatus Firestonebacteria bacterium]
MKIRVAVLTVSDRSSRGERQDESGPAIIEEVKKFFEEIELVKCEIVPDEQDIIKEKIITYTDSLKTDLVLTTGGTGVALRDVTPEATLSVIEKEVPGFSEIMRQESFKKTPNALLSRAVSGTRGKSLIINLPGSPKAVRECLSIIHPAIFHAIEILKGVAKE